MALPENSVFVLEDWPVVEIDWEVGNAWKRQRIEFCDNNGWDLPGNAWLLTDNELERLDDQLNLLGIDWRDYATFYDYSYITTAFGFDDKNIVGSFEIYDENLELCGEIMEELGLKWSGWAGAGFILIATEAQVLELIERLREPVREFHELEYSWWYDREPRYQTVCTM